MNGGASTPPREAMPVIGHSLGSTIDTSDSAPQITALAMSGTDPYGLSRILQAAVTIDGVAEAVSVFDGLAIVLPSGAPTALVPVSTDYAGWRRSRRAPWSMALQWVDEPHAPSTLIDLAPTDGNSDWLLARCLREVPNPALRTSAVRALGVGRIVNALGLRPVHEDAHGRLFHVGPQDAPSAFLLVRDRVLGLDGAPMEHWISVPPHVATTHEAVAWSFEMSVADYHPAAET